MYKGIEMPSHIHVMYDPLQKRVLCDNKNPHNFINLNVVLSPGKMRAWFRDCLNKSKVCDWCVVKLMNMIVANDRLDKKHAEAEERLKRKREHRQPIKQNKHYGLHIVS